MGTYLCLNLSNNSQLYAPQMPLKLFMLLIFMIERNTRFKIHLISILRLAELLGISVVYI